MSFPSRLPLWPLAGMVGVILAGSAYAEIYKWVDDKGVVNYTSTPPPPGRAATGLSKDSDISVVSPPPLPPDAARSATDMRADRLERELAAERAARAARGAQDQAAEDRRLAAVAQCEESRGVDCEENPYQYDSGGYAGGGYAGGGYYPGRPYLRHRMDGMVVPTPLPVIKHNPAPRTPPPPRQGALMRD